jgi:hypothetical protein
MPQQQRQVVQPPRKKKLGTNKQLKRGVLPR